jgi:hypothetical protein
MIIGSFYFKITNNHNLIGEFTNNDPNECIRTENAQLIKSNSRLIGIYQSTWFDNAVHLADLEIMQKNNNNTYKLEWKEKGIITYQGEGFLMDNETLIGFYQSV